MCIRDRLNKKQFITLTYPQITNDLENSIKSFYKFTGKKMTLKFQKQVSDYASKKYVKKHKNKTIEDYGFTRTTNSYRLITIWRLIYNT